MKNNILIGVFVFIVLLLAFFSKILANPENAVTINADLMRMTSLWESQITENLKEGNGIILWNPDVFSGTLFIGSPLTAMFYPLSLIFYFVPFHNALAFFIVFSVALMALFSYLYFRNIGISRFSSFFATVAFVFSGMAVLWSGIMSFINALVWFPLLLYLAERLVRERKPAYGLVMGLVFGIQILGSGPQIFLYSSFVVALYVILRVLYERKEPFKVIGILIAAGFIGILVGAVQLLPMLEYGKYSIRDEGLSYDIATMHSLPGYALATLFAPEFYGRGSFYWGFWEHSSFAEQYLYLGLSVLMLLLIAIFFVRKNKYVSIFSIIGLFALLFSFGKYTPFFKMFYYLPLFSSFRAPVRMMIFFVFSAAAISGFSIDSLNSFDANKKKRLGNIAIGIGIILAVAGFTAVSLYIEQDKAIEAGKNFVSKLYEENAGASRITRGNLSKDYFLNLVPVVFKNTLDAIEIFLVIAVAITFLFYLWSCNKIRLKHLKILLLLVLVADLFLFSTKFLEPSSFEDKFSGGPILDEIKSDDGLYRVLSMRSYQTKDYLPQYLAVYNGVQLASGCDAIFLRKYAEYSCYYGSCEVKADACIPINDIKYPKMVDMLNVKYVVSPKELNDDSMSFIFNKNGINLYKNRDYLERAYFVPDYIEVDEHNALEVMSDRNFDPKRYVAITGDIDIEADGIGSYKSLNIGGYSPNNVVIEDNFTNDGFVVLSDVNYPGWKAYIDGKETKIYDANYILRAVYVDGGEHKIEFLYRPLSYRVGLYLSIITVLGVLIIAFRLRL